MSDGLYVTGCEPATGKSAIALGVFELLARRVGRLGVFRPVVSGREAGGGRDGVVDLLLPRAHGDLSPDACVGVTYADVLADEDRAPAKTCEPADVRRSVDPALGHGDRLVRQRSSHDLESVRVDSQGDEVTRVHADYERPASSRDAVGLGCSLGLVSAVDLNERVKPRLCCGDEQVD